MTATDAMPMTTSAPEEARAAGLNPLDHLKQRGYVQDVSDEAGLRSALGAGPATAYVGFDPSAPSLHVGNLVGIMMLANLQRFGHRPIALGGGGTALVGDPTGRTSARAPISPADVDANLAGVLPQFGRYLDFDGGRFGDNPPALLLNNADWLAALRYLEFLRDIGRHFSVNEMLSAETYRQRLETTGLNFVELNYRLVQAYDYLHLFRAEGCLLQMGGSDQWGNIVGGVDLIRRADGGKAFALVSPLITTAAGEKMGKTAGNAVWLDAARTSPYDYFQFWVNTADVDVGRFLRLFTFLPEERIAALTAAGGRALREAKRVLAFEATALTHGAAAAAAAAAEADAYFGGGRSIEASANFSATSNLDVKAEVIPGITFADLLVRTGLCKSRNEARRLAAQGGLSIDGERVEDADAFFRGEAGTSVLLQAGKKRRHLVHLV